MSDPVASLFALAVFVGWGLIARAVGIAAAKKNRRRWLWTIMAVVPLGPIVGPLWLASMPVAGEKATTGQQIGRAVLVTLIVLSQVGRIVQLGEDQRTKNKAISEFGYETETVTKHYKKMNVDESVMCVQLNSQVTTMMESATLDESGETYLFETQREADIYNTALTLNDEMECQDRTYDFPDLDEAMERIEREEVDPITDILTQRVDFIESMIARWNAQAPAMVDDSTRFDGMTLVGDSEVITQFVLVAYDASEISQEELTEAFEPRLASGTCSDPDLSSLRDNGYTLTHQYRGINGGYVGTIRLAGEC